MINGTDGRQVEEMLKARYAEGVQSFHVLPLPFPCLPLPFQYLHVFIDLEALPALCFIRGIIF